MLELMQYIWDLENIMQEQWHQNFAIDEYIKCLDYAHIRGVKVYLTLNTLVEDSDIKEILDMLLKLYEYGLDAVILQDIGACKYYP